MKFVSLFTGIGGLDLGLERAGHECVLQVENDPYCQRVLEKHWPNVRRVADVHDVTAEDCEGADLMVGGFPCQPVSVAGRQRGIEDDRWLWPEYARLIRLVRPGHVLVENVPGLLMGGGMGAVLGDLAGLGYDAEWESIPAAAVGAPHLRYRVFIVGTKQRRPLADPDERHDPAKETVSAGRNAPRAGGADVAHARGSRRDAHQQDIHGRESDTARSGGRDAVREQGLLMGRSRTRDEGQAGDLLGGVGSMGSGPPGSDDRTQGSQPEADVANADSQPLVWPPVTRQERDHWAVEPGMGRLADGISDRVAQLRALGNAVVPQVAEYVGRMLPP